MQINEILKNKNITIYRLSKNSTVPYTTLNDICSGKTNLAKCSAETVYRIAKALNMSMEELLSSCMEKRPSFELFKSNVCHRLKELGDVNFVIELLENDDISMYYNKRWYPESFYLLGMLDYISRINDIPICGKYDALRKQKLKSVIYPSSIISLASAMKSELPKEQARAKAIPEFIRFNIVENEVRNVN